MPGPGAVVRVHVTREACCAADDQVGPLDAVFELEAEATLATLVARIAGSGFLQFSSTHTCLTGEVGGVALVAVTNDGAAPRFSVDPQAQLVDVLRGRVLHFGFRRRGAAWA